MSVSLSVALCTYNGAPYINEQLNSILNQRLPVNEIIIIDDGSTDKTLSLVESVSKLHPDVSWTIQKNQKHLGITLNFESALSACHGDIVFLSDQDDMWVPEKTQRIVDYFERHSETSLVFTDAQLIDNSGKRITERTLFDICGFKELIPAWVEGLQFEIENVLQRVLGATLAVRRSFIQHSLPFHREVNNYHDGQLAMQSVVDNSNGFIEECLTYYRIHSNNVVGLGGNAGGRLSGVILNPWSDLVEPRDVNGFFLLPCASPIRHRVQFFIKRKNNYARVLGKLILAGSILAYVKYYRRFWFRFYSSDLLYGVSERLRQHLIQRWH